ncbi:MAG: hypothetical protein DRQ49_14715 [Gammaproteobacteria bacterium]|nr:MAG: hypothetical protein DRQ49_14715 [Gammaproteobacteria bacterium]RKZ42653.1 MAG: hypothetical protein DRQ41_06765 [Gammaproteobacteria bacterium]RKZ72532.1 MAG: hypothetical protein DRQ57_17175 [Gammaproteobacteria bacterium]
MKFIKLLLIAVMVALSLNALAVEQRIALVIGNSHYPDGAFLPNPQNDAKDIAQVLRDYGFTVTHKQDLDQEKMDKAIIDFGKALTKDGVGLFYFAGHAIHIDQRNYLVPIGKRIPEIHLVKYRAIDAQWIVEVMHSAGSRMNVVVLDTCRNNPFLSYLHPSEGLAAMHAPKGTIISYASTFCKKSADANKRNGLYTTHLLETIKRPGLTIEEVFKQTATAVDSASGGRQVPWRSSSLTGKDFCFSRCRKSGLAVKQDVTDLLATCESYMNQYWFTTSPTGETALNCYQQVLKKQANNQPAFQGLKRIEDYYSDKVEKLLEQGRKQQAKTYIARLRQVSPESPKIGEFENQFISKPIPKPTPPTTIPISPVVSGKTFQDRLKDGSLGPEIVHIPAGRFQMGDIQGGGDSDEKPVHQVSVSEFAMGKYEVTFAEYDKFVQSTKRKKPSDFGWVRGNRPVIYVSWDDAVAYAEWLSQQTGKTYRLPTEAEWEYAARAGTETKYWWGNTVSHEYANYGKDECCDGLAKGKDRWKYTSPVGSFEPNPFGLYDMVGNVYEWTCSEYEGKYSGKEKQCTSQKRVNLPVIRGGSWLNDAWLGRAAGRFRGSHGNRNNYVGFRLVRITL